MLPLSKNGAGFNFYNKSTQGKAISMSLFLYLMLVVFLAGCNLIGGRTQSNNGIYLTTNGTQFHVKDSINVTLVNNSASGIGTSSSCGPTFNLYQQWINKHWSETKYILPPTWGCANSLDTLKSGGKISETILANYFDTTGTFRLVTSYYGMNSHRETIFSNKFTLIK